MYTRETSHRQGDVFMEMIRRITFSVVMAYLLLMLTACGGGRSGEMAALLDRADSLNRAYVPMTDGIDSLLLEATKYYDRHGTANQQMRAHYLLGCAYRDMGEAPAALQSYQDAVDRVDTLSSDCDYYTLCRVYAQMSDILYHQNLLPEYLKSINSSVHYSWMAKDTMMALNETVYKIVAYNDMERYDSVEYIFDEAFSQLSAYYGIKYASRYSVLPIKSFLSMKKFDRVRNCLNNYERESGYMDSMGNVSQGHEIYYFYKGQYYLETNRLDSAELFFRKELTAKDHNNQNAASFGLAQLYQQKSMPDSAAKYALYSYAMNDSANNELATNVIEVSQAMYNYQRFLKKADAESRKAERFNLYFLVSVFSFVVLVLITFVAGYVLVQKKRRLEERIELLRGYAVNQNLRDSPIAQQFRELLKTNPYHQPELKDWKELSAVIDREAPHFHKTLCQGDVQLSDFEYDVCMLIKIQIPLSDIARLKQCVPSYITQTRKHIFQKLFKKKGRADELDEYIMKLL